MSENLDRDNTQRRAELLSKVEEYEDQERQNLADSLSIVDRLTRRTANKTIPLLMEDDLGEFTVNLRFMTREEKREATDLLAKFASFSDPQTGDGRDALRLYDDTITGMLKLAQSVVTTDGVAEYLEAASNTDDIIVAIIVTGLKGTLASIGDGLKGFRQE